MRANLLVVVVALMAAALVPGCGGGRWSEEESLIPDSEIDAMKSELLSTSGDTAAAGGAHVKVVWGFLAGKFWNPPDWIDWTGSMTVDGGEASLESLVYFDDHDQLQPKSAPNRIDFKSRTRPHYDGFVALIEPATSADVVHLDTASFTTDVAAADLAKGVNLHFSVDAEGHEVSITSLPAGACGGFAYGYQKPSKKGWLAFGGRFTDPAGKVQGKLRFRADGSAIQGRLLDESGDVIAEGTGTLTGKDFELSLSKPDGTGIGTVKGLYQPPTYSVRGAFQATWLCPQ